MLPAIPVPARALAALAVILALVAAPSVAVAVHASHGSSVAPGAACITRAHGGDSAVEALEDTQGRVSIERRQDQRVRLERGDVFAAIALGSATGQGISPRELADIDASSRVESDVTFEHDLDRRDVFAALSLGVRAYDGIRSPLACQADFQEWRNEEQILTQRVDLSKRHALLAIALESTAAVPTDWRDVASISRSERDAHHFEREAEFPLEETLNLLALGARAHAG